MKKILFSLLILTSPAYARATQQPAEPNLTPQEIKQINGQIESARKDISLKLNVVDNYLKIGHLYMRLNDADQAQSACESALKVDPRNAKAHFMLGLIFEKKKMNDRAIYHWQRCLENATNPQMKQVAQKHLDYLSGK